MLTFQIISDDINYGPISKITEWKQLKDNLCILFREFNVYEYYEDFLSYINLYNIDKIISDLIKNKQSIIHLDEYTIYCYLN